MARRLRAALACCALLGACAAPPPAVQREVGAALSAAQPERAAGASAKPGWTFRHQAVVAAHPLAADAGAQMLRAGGSALDAAIAAQMVLGLVEPQSSGIGGGGFLVLWDGRAVQAWDGRETAPASAGERLFIDPATGKPRTFDAALVGGLAVGTPGLVRMLEAAHRRHGVLPWARLFEPAIVLAEQGFAISPRLHRLLDGDPHLRRDRFARALYYDAGGAALAVGATLRNPEYGAVLRAIAARGADALHRGEIASAIVAAVRGHATNPGLLTEADLAGYAPRQRDALCADWLQRRLCGMPPPSSGLIAVAQILGITQRASARQGVDDALDVQGLPTPEFLHVYADASRLAFADRNQYVADPDFVAPPAGSWASLLAPAYLTRRAELIGPQSLGRALPGVPEGATIAHAQATGPEPPSTSHLVAVDAQGRGVALTSSIEQQFGARLMVNRGRGLAGGFLLNNQLTDFSFVAEQDGRPVANRAQGGKRPRSSMAPLLAFDRSTGQLMLATGSAGGAAIIHHAAKALLGEAWGLAPQQAADLPNFGAFNEPTTWLERDRFADSTWNALRARGHVIEATTLPSGVHTLMRRPVGGWAAGADPRREGAARGD
ncbi:MAG: gamma-glutamyltransferase family protein [Ideonella sp.]|nr:gamma-glutamyltransferase family protein [Ideonella sp.]